MNVKTDIMLSNHHVHLSEEAARTLFGEAGITMKGYTNDTKVEFAANETVTLAGPKGKVEKVRVLGPCRGDIQAELLASDNYKLGVEAPVRMSGDLDGAAELTIIGPMGEVEADCGIIAMRHIHMGYDTAAELGVKNNDEISVRVGGIRGLIFEHVVLRVSKKVARDVMMHIDTEEGNAAGLKNNDSGEVIESMRLS